MNLEKNLWKILTLGLALLLTWSFHEPHDRLTWWLEVMPALMGYAVIMLLWKKFKFTNFTLVFIALQMCILIIGGKYTYAKVPAFDWISDLFSWERNYYDRLGHFAQGFVPALISREAIIRKNIVNGKIWTFWIVIAICLAISAIYELVEFVAAHILKRGADDFLGTQGSVWDTQWDMLWALVGAFFAQIFCTKAQDRAIEKIRI